MNLPGDPIYAPLSGRACVWYAYRIDRWRRDRRGGHWVSVAEGCSDAIFALEDGSGRCIVDPEGAEVETERVQSWHGHRHWPVPPPGHDDPLGPYRYTERWLEPGETLYALGWFETLRDEGDGGLNAEVQDLLRRWKGNRKALLQRFDLNRDGEIDLREWQLVRKQAEREVLRQRMERAPIQAVHVLRQPPRRNYPFILAAHPQSWLVSRYRVWASVYLIAFVVACAILAWAIQIRFSCVFPGRTDHRPGVASRSFCRQ